MFDAMERVAYLSKTAKGNKELRFKKLYKIVQKPEFLKVAYDQIRNNKGANTAGVDGVVKTEYEISEVYKEAIQDLAEVIRSETYKPLPVRRVTIPKKNGKRRPLGIPSLKDRIVQSAIKIILEAIYEPVFKETSHGFRPRRSCQTAINDITCRKYDWVVEGDIKGCFDNINHVQLLDILRKRIADERFINLINKFLKSGYQMGYGIDGKHPIYETKDGTPQGGIISPVLANVYLHEFDKFIQTKLTNMKRHYKYTKKYNELNNRIQRIQNAIDEGKTSYKARTYLENEDKPKDIHFANKQEIQQHIDQLKKERTEYERKSREYSYLSNRISRLSRVNNFPFTTKPYGASKYVEYSLNSKEEMINEIKRLRKEVRNTPKYDKESYFNDTSIGYTRYADDFVILIGNQRKESAKELKEEIKRWLMENLKLTLSDEKTTITHATEGFKFVGYYILKTPSQTCIGYNGFSKVYVPDEAKDKVKENIEKILRNNYHLSAYDLFHYLNRIINGWGNFYKICNNYSKVANKLDAWLFWKVCHWLGKKYKLRTMSKVFKRFRTQSRVQKWGANAKRLRVSLEDNIIYSKRFSDIKYISPGDISRKIKSNAHKEAQGFQDTIKKIYGQIGNGFSPQIYYESIAKYGKKCMECGEENVTLRVHHTRMVKRSSRKDQVSAYESSRNLKSVLLCTKCHKKKHPTNHVIKG
ncbi:reverse transcriptase domain-containing protein [Priestia filamentosa]|uniref:reverse transcriptase domain-containing protein n=1 Tax=Priestia filamentosa TaxID=1402861 RepID=UPI003978EE3B